MGFSKKLIAIVFILLCCVFPVYASQIEKTDTNEEKMQEDTKKEQESEEVKKQKEKLKKKCKEMIEQMQRKLNEIDAKIVSLRKTEEYEMYPTIRLNIDTPFFGMKSIINQKLKITKDVAATDVAKGYSVRSIVKSKMVKCPDITVGKIVVSTKDVDIEDSLSISEYNLLILKLMNYLEKTNTIYHFLDTQTNKMFKEYISKEKKDTLNDIHTRLETIDKKLLEQDLKLLTLSYLDLEHFDSLLESYNTLNKRQNELSSEVTNILIESSKLTELQKKTLVLESDMIDYTNEIDTLLEQEQTDIEKVVKNMSNSFQESIKKVTKYIESSQKKVDKKQENSEEKEDKEQQEKQKIEEQEIKKVYEVYAQKDLESLKNIEKRLKDKIKELEISLEDEKEKSEEMASEKDEITDSQEEKKKRYKYQTLSEEETKKQLEEILSMNQEFLKIEYDFYLNNVNNLLKEMNGKVTNLAEYTQVDIMSDIEYIYSELPKNLENYLDFYHVNSSIELRMLISNFQKELSTLNQKYQKVMEIYEKMNVESKMNGD